MCRSSTRPIDTTAVNASVSFLLWWTETVWAKVTISPLKLLCQEFLTATSRTTYFTLCCFSSGSVLTWQKSKNQTVWAEAEEVARIFGQAHKVGVLWGPAYLQVFLRHFLNSEAALTRGSKSWMIESLKNRIEMEGVSQCWGDNWYH